MTWHYVVATTVHTDVSEKSFASFFRVKHLEDTKALRSVAVLHTTGTRAQLLTPENVNCPKSWFGKKTILHLLSLHS